MTPPRTPNRRVGGQGKPGSGFSNAFPSDEAAGASSLGTARSTRSAVDVEKVPSEKGPPRKVYSVNAQGREYLKEFWGTWSFLAERLEQLQEGGI